MSTTVFKIDSDKMDCLSIREESFVVVEEVMLCGSRGTHVKTPTHPSQELVPYVYYFWDHPPLRFF